VQLRITTAAAPLVLDAVVFEETGYPYPEDGAFACDDPTLMELMAICTRTARRCARESFMDCPYYEQQQWVGDMRVQMLISHVVLRDSRLVKRCIEFIGDAREGDDMVFGRYPAPQRLWIPSFALAWCGMVYDLARWRDERDFVGARMPALRATLDRFLRSVGDDDLLVVPAGWNYTDWAEGWRNGEPCPPGEPNAVLQMWLVWVLGQAVELETWLEEPEFSARWARHRGRLTASAVGAYWHEERGLFSDDVGGTRFSELANALAVLSGAFPARYVDRLREALPEAGAGVTRCALYADNYLLDAFVSLGRMDAYEMRLERYRAFMEQRLMTTPEHPGTTRSDCHAWSAHPRYHAVASVLGIRPDAFGFGRVLIRPQLGGLDRAAGSVPHPNGTITCEVRREGDGLSGWVDLPPGTTGAFVCPDGREVTLVSGRTGLG
jgi:hypothetical protein